ncbi:hypothetical protein UlMin_036172 [Ulmus minor]
MEAESEKRKDRLRAMRADAAQAENSTNVVTSAMPHHLLNPLLENPAAMPLQEESRATARFDYYTDPMAAFSGNKRRNMSSDQVATGHFTPQVNQFQGNCPPDPAMNQPQINQFHSNYSPDPRMYRPQSNQFPNNYSPDPRMYRGQGFGHSSFQGNPVGMSRPFNNVHQGNPGFPLGPGSGVSHNFSPTPPRFPSPRFGPAGSPTNASGQGRSQWFNRGPSPSSGHGGSPSPRSGRGWNRGYTSNMSPGSGRGGGRGQGFGGRSSPMDRASRPERFYNDSMIEDPWKSLQPVIWRGVDSSKSWTPRSIGTKNASVSDASNKSSSQPSLAEYLAASFNEATNDPPST